MSRDQLVEAVRALVRGEAAEQLGSHIRRYDALNDALRAYDEEQRGVIASGHVAATDTPLATLLGIPRTAEATHVPCRTCAEMRESNHTAMTKMVGQLHDANRIIEKLRAELGRPDAQTDARGVDAVALDAARCIRRMATDFGADFPCSLLDELEAVALRRSEARPLTGNRDIPASFITAIQAVIREAQYHGSSNTWSLPSSVLDSLSRETAVLRSAAATVCNDPRHAVDVEIHDALNGPKTVRITAKDGTLVHACSHSPVGAAAQPDPRIGHVDCPHAETCNGCTSAADVERLLELAADVCDRAAIANEHEIASGWVRVGTRIFNVLTQAANEIRELGRAAAKSGGGT